jgi:hypothetical protein
MSSWLHDIVEDTWVTLEDLRRAEYPPAVIATVDAMTRRDGEVYRAYIRRLAGNPLARIVKRADLRDNLAEARRLGPEYDSLRKRHQWALNFLEGSL